MNVDDAARKLRQRIAAPPGAVAVWAWHSDPRPYLLVRIDAKYPFDVRKIPTRFEGYRVVIERRAPAKAAMG